MRKTCDLLNDKNTCDSTSCCMWCNSKNKCVGGKNGVPLYDIDNDCVDKMPSNDSEMVKMAKNTLKEIKKGKIDKLEKDFEYKSIEEMTHQDYKIVLQLIYHFIKQKKHRDALTVHFNEIPKGETRSDYLKRYYKVFDKFIIYYVKINPNSTAKLYKNQGESVIMHISKNSGEKYIELLGNSEIKELINNCMSVMKQDVNFYNSVQGIETNNLDDNINLNPPSELNTNVTNISPTRTQMQIMQQQI